MGDGASSSSRAGGGGGGGETIVTDLGRRIGSCGYCRSRGSTSLSHGLEAHSITVDDYQELLDRGWRRSGAFLYKPDMERTCCPSYTIRLKANDFVPSKEQVRVLKKMQRFLDGAIDLKRPEPLNDKVSTIKGLCSTESRNVVSEPPMKGFPARKCEKMTREDGYIQYLSTKIDDAISACFGSGEFPCKIQLPKAVVKKVTLQGKKKIKAIAEDLLYTSSIAFQICSVMRQSQTAEKNLFLSGFSRNGACQTGDCLGLSPNIIAEKFACSLVRQGEISGLFIKACNGHLNFYSATKQIDSDEVSATANASQQTPKGDGGSAIRSHMPHNSKALPHKKRRLEIHMKRSSFDPEEYALYRRYQLEVHKDRPGTVTEISYRRFLVDTPLIFIPPCTKDRSVPPCGFGSFHQQYLIDGRLVAVGVVDVLPRCLSSKYLFWDPDLAFLSLGKYTALKEIEWVKEIQVRCPRLQFYYLGYYIHSCSKMRYKAAYRPSELLCPLRYQWVPFDIARPQLDKRAYVVLSDFVSLQNGESSPCHQLPKGSTRQSCGDPDHEVPSDFPSDEDEEMELQWEDMESGPNDELDLETSEPNDDLETSSATLANELATNDISNIEIDLNGSRIKFKDLQLVLGPIEKEKLNLLGLQLQQFIRTVGTELSNHMVYALG